MSPAPSQSQPRFELNDVVIGKLLQELPIFRPLLSDHVPVYCLPKSIIECLARHSEIRYFEENAASELRLTEIVASSTNRVGFIQGEFISTQLIDTDSFAADPYSGQTRNEVTHQVKPWRDYLVENGPTEHYWDYLRESFAHLYVRSSMTEKRSFMQAMAFGLLNDSAYMEDQKQLSERWNHLPVCFRSPFLCGRDPSRFLTFAETEDQVPNQSSENYPYDDGAIHEINQWFADYRRFLDRFELNNLAYWGLPEAISRLPLPFVLPTNQAVRTSGQAIYTHSLDPLRARDKEFETIEEIQLTSSHFKPSHSVRFAASHQLDCSRCFLTDFLENAIRQRLPGQSIPYGKTEAILDAISQYLHLDLDRLQSIRSRMKCGIRRNS